jgi:aldehyde dehydrogenase (NAD+)
VYDDLVAELARAVRSAFGKDPRRHPDFGRIVDDRHFDRLVGLLEGTSPDVGGQHDRSERYIAPTVVAGVAPDHRLMQEEIFGPILPVLRVRDAVEALEVIEANPHPLALYVFSEDAAVRATFEEGSISGALAFNAPLAHQSTPGLPFGGVGSSGYGRYHGEHSIREFSHERAVLDKPLRPDTLAVLYPSPGRALAGLRRLMLRPMHRRS